MNHRYYFEGKVKYCGWSKMLLVRVWSTHWTIQKRLTKGWVLPCQVISDIRLTGHRVRVPSAEWSGRAQSNNIFLDKACSMKLDKMSHYLDFLHKNVSKNCFPRQTHEKHKEWYQLSLKRHSEIKQLKAKSHPVSDSGSWNRHGLDAAGGVLTGLV